MPGLGKICFELMQVSRYDQGHNFKPHEDQLVDSNSGSSGSDGGGSGGRDGSSALNVY